mgnify:CR=1 FL=1
MIDIAEWGQREFSIFLLLSVANHTCILNYLNDDGVLIEPEYFYPILPTLLVNGTEGIGTGFSTSIPCYNPLKIVENI